MPSKTMVARCLFTPTQLRCGGSGLASLLAPTHSPQQGLQHGPGVGTVCHVAPLIHPAVQNLQAHKPGRQGRQAGRGRQPASSRELITQLARCAVAVANT